VTTAPSLTPAILALIFGPVLFMAALGANASLAEGLHVPVALGLAALGFAIAAWAAARGQRRVRGSEGLDVAGAFVLAFGAVEAVGFASFALAALTALL
jgi:hypothetical protein